MFLLLVAIVIVCWRLAACFVIGRYFGRFLYLTSKIPGPSFWEILTVHTKKVLSGDALSYTCELCSMYEHKPWGVWMNSDYMISVSDSETLGEVYKNKHLADKPDVLYRLIAEYLGECLLTLNGEEYKLHRKMVNPAFRKCVLESHLPLINSEGVNLIEQLRNKAEGKSIDVRPIISNQSIVVSFLTFTSGAYVYPNVEKFSEAIKKGTKVVHIRTINPLYYWLVYKRKESFKRAEAEIKTTLDDFKKKFLEQKHLAEDRMAKDDKSPSNLLECLVQGSKDFGLTEDEFSEEARTLLMASGETTGFTLNVCLLLLALNPGVQDRLFEEVTSVIGSKSYVRSEDLSRLVYTEMVIKETLRLFPPGPIIAKKVAEETNLGGMVVPRGSSVLINSMALHRNPKNFKDPLKFDPDRFSPESSQGRHPYAFNPFSAGVRACPGQAQGFIVLKTLLCHLLANFKVLPGDELNSFEDIKVKMYSTMYLSQSSLKLFSRER